MRKPHRRLVSREIWAVPRFCDRSVGHWTGWPPRWKLPPRPSGNPFGRGRKLRFSSERHAALKPLPISGDGLRPDQEFGNSSFRQCSRGSGHGPPQSPTSSAAICGAEASDPLGRREAVPRSVEAYAAPLGNIRKAGAAFQSIPTAQPIITRPSHPRGLWRGGARDDRGLAALGGIRRSDGLPRRLPRRDCGREPRSCPAPPRPRGPARPLLRHLHLGLARRSEGVIVEHCSARHESHPCRPATPCTTSHHSPWGSPTPRNRSQRLRPFPLDGFLSKNACIGRPPRGNFHAA
jgi:hypothetical protein